MIPDIQHTVLDPVGALKASWSNVRHSPPDLRILARAVSVKRSAATLSLGRLYSLTSSVTVPTTTAILSSYIDKKQWVFLVNSEEYTHEVYHVKSIYILDYRDSLHSSITVRFIY